MTVRVEVAEPETGKLAGDRLVVGPAGETVAEQATVPVKPLTLVTVTVEVPL